MLRVCVCERERKREREIKTTNKYNRIRERGKERNRVKRYEHEFKTPMIPIDFRINALSMNVWAFMKGCERKDLFHLRFHGLTHSR